MSNNSYAEEMLEKIFFYMNRLVSEKDFYKTICILTDLGKTLVSADRVSFWYWDKAKKQYWTLATSDMSRIIVPEGTGVVGASIANKETIIINHPYKDVRFNPEVDKETGYTTKSILCMPVTNEKGEVIGAYQAINKIDEFGDSYFDQLDVKRLTLAAVYSAKMLETRLLHMASQVDQLTGLKNRRGFSNSYRKLIVNPENKNGSCMIMCDIDFFKKVNDTYGHNAGDEELKHIANILRTNVDQDGEVIRWGGEEFVILLPNVEKGYAVSLAKKIRENVQESACNYDGIDIKVTMSFGVIKIDEDLEAEDNIKMVDGKLYMAKANGRNIVIY